MDTILTGYSNPSDQHAAHTAIAENLDRDWLAKEEAGNDSGLGPGPGVLSNLAPISVDDAGLGVGDGDGDGEAITGSGETFDSAMKRMAASSSVNLEAGSPVESLHDDGSPLREHLGHHPQLHSSSVSLEAGSPVESLHDGGSPLREHLGHHPQLHHEHHFLHHDGSEGKVVLANDSDAEGQSTALHVANFTPDDEPLVVDEAREDGLEYEDAEEHSSVIPLAVGSAKDIVEANGESEEQLSAMRVLDDWAEDTAVQNGDGEIEDAEENGVAEEQSLPMAVVNFTADNGLHSEEPQEQWGARPISKLMAVDEPLEAYGTRTDIAEEAIEENGDDAPHNAEEDWDAQEHSPAIPVFELVTDDELLEDEEDSAEYTVEENGDDALEYAEAAESGEDVTHFEGQSPALRPKEIGDATSMGAAGPSLPARPAGPGRSVPSQEPVLKASSSQRGGGAPISTQPSSAIEEAQPNGDANDEHDETRDKLQSIRVKFLRLARRLGQSAHNVVVAQVLYRLGLAEQLRGGRSSGRSAAFGFDRACAIAEEQEAAGPGDLDFTCTIMVLGKTGVGKSASINSIFDEVKTVTNAFSPATTKVQEIVGTVHGVKVRVIDTPGFLPSVADQRRNEEVMSSVKRFIKKSPPDIVLYFDRLDMQSRDFGDLPLLRTITNTLGPAVWFNAIVVLTHAASALPDGPNGLPLSYEMFVAQRSHMVQQIVRHAAGDMRLLNPVSLVENHPACRTNRAGQRVLPNGQIWKPQLLLLCFASKILAEANALLKLQDSAPGRPFGSRQSVPPLPFLLSSLLQSRQQLKTIDDQGGDEDGSDDELDEEDNSDDEAEFDQLPPFRRLTKDEVLDLDDQQRKDYSQELADRERLFQKKQWKEELRRRKELRKRVAAAKEQLAEEVGEEECARSAAVPVPLPDMVLPPSFDSDSPTHRYRYLEAPNKWLVRPVLETNGWDHDSGYDGLSVEHSFTLSNKFPAQVSGQLTKDKKETNLTLECATSFKHGEGKVTLSGLDMQTIGKDCAYTLRSETQFSNFKQNKTTGGLTLTFLEDTIAAGLKLENRLIVGKRLKLVMNGGALTGKGNVAYGGSLEATLRDADYPFSRNISTLGLSLMDWQGDVAIGGNLQSHFLLGKTSVSARANLNNRGAGQISIRSRSSEQLQMALVGLVPILRALVGLKLFGSSQAGQ